MSDWSNGKEFMCTKYLLGQPWGFPGGKLRCYLCGHRFKAGDTARFQYAAGGNFFVCSDCDGHDVVQRWDAHRADFKQRFWWAYR